MKRLLLRLRWALGLTGQCPELEPCKGVRGACQRREGHPGPHDSHWMTWNTRSSMEGKT